MIKQKKIMNQISKEVSSSDDESNKSIIKYNSDNDSSESNTNKNSIIKQ